MERMGLSICFGFCAWTRYGHAPFASVREQLGWSCDRNVTVLENLKWATATDGNVQEHYALVMGEGS